MNQQDYVQAVEDMKIPAYKALEWVHIIKDKYSKHYIETNRQYQETVRNLFDEVAESSQKLANLIPQMQTELQAIETDSLRASEIFTHILAGPIIVIRDYSKLILHFPFWLPEAEQTEDEQEHIRYVKKINSAGEFLASLDRDVVLKRMLDKLDE
jgi:hypothetical protein